MLRIRIMNNEGEKMGDDEEVSDKHICDRDSMYRVGSFYCISYNHISVVIRTWDSKPPRQW